MSTESPAQTGRRERKRLETRANLVDAALELFADRGFDAVTVTDIAERADVDPSTFFRNFGSKEAVLFTDQIDAPQRMREALLRRPDSEPLLDALAAVLLEVGTQGLFDPERELLRAELSESTPAIRALSLVYKENLTLQLAQTMAERNNIDTDKDIRPYLAATVWVASLEWYRKMSISSGKRPKSIQQAIDDIVALVRPVWPLADEKRRPIRRSVAAPASSTRTPSRKLAPVKSNQSPRKIP
jgi:AcrR family transcriptional regulator